MSQDSEWGWQFNLKLYHRILENSWNEDKFSEQSWEQSATLSLVAQATQASSITL